MSVFKEEIRALEDLWQRQVRIYPDAADYGVLATNKIKETTRWVLKSLMSLGGNSSVHKIDHPGYVERKYRLTVYWSESEGTTAIVTYINDKQRAKEFFTIELHNTFNEDNEEDDYRKR